MNCRELNCEKIKPFAAWSHCSTCHESFTCDFAFDMHRIGRFGVDRRCATESEMVEKGMSLNSKGHWRTWSGVWG